MTDSQTQRVAIVTGAGRGIGRATAAALDAAGYATVLVGRTAKTLEETAEPLTQPTLVHVADITDAAQCQQVIDATVERFGRVDVLANVAGFAKLMKIEQITPEDWQQTVGTNLSAIVYLTSAVWPIFKKQGGGYIVNVSSMSAYDPFPGLGAYGAAKLGVNMFTKVTADEGKKMGVRAVCVVPGAVETPMLRAMFSEKMLPSEKTLDPAKVAKLILDCIEGRREVASGEAVTIVP
ncbi:MAG: SDR family oxidoreductase [Phycisphaeraceae bacterium]